MVSPRAHRRPARAPAAIAALVLLPAAAFAQASAGDQAPADVTLPTIEVIGVSPILGTGIDRDKVPANTRSFSPSDLSLEGTPALVGTLQQRVPSVNINDVQDSPFQPDVQYRGFDASPVAGTPQGLAVYQNGVRINEAFGDTVNWDLVPDFAINRVNLMSSNPAFGLNALGGALAVEMKNGFNFSGGQAELSGGSFDRIDGLVEYGARAGTLASYIGTRNVYDGGWRDHSPSSLHQIYADLGAEGERLGAHLSFTGASNLINAIGPTPVQLLAASRSAVFTTPQSTRNDLAFLTLSGSFKASDTLSIDGNTYYRHFRQRISNGNTTDAQPCTTPGLLCFGDGATPLIDTAGTQVPDVLNGQTPGEIDRTATDADGLGGSLQLTETAPLLGHGNHLVAGFSLDHGNVDFATQSELGIIERTLLVSGTGFIIDEPAGDLAPVSLTTTNSYYGLYLADTFDVTSRLAVTASGRYNLAFIRLDDHLGTSISGDHRFARFDPALGATYKLLPNLTAYAGYAEANRAPTPGELACADPARPCILDNFLVSDPDLKQVVARTYEAGLRGTLAGFEERSRFTWNLGVFRTDDQDDILNVPSTISGFGFFRNVGNTRRQGIEAGINYRSDRWLAYLDYAFLDATFRSPITLSSPNNPFADANGNISVKPGDHIPSLPTHRVKLGADYGLTPHWRAGADLVVASGQFLRGDESNQNPKIPGYHVVNLRTSYTIGDHVELFGLIRNLLDERYDTFGTFFNTGQIPFLALTDPRTESPGAPRGFFAGVRVTF
jgi:iron complex outermembrane receptor protein